MRFNLHWRSFLAGAGLVALFGVGFAATAPDRPNTGRFQGAAGPNHLLIVDTRTGKAWTKFVSDASGATSKNFHKSKVRK